MKQILSLSIAIALISLSACQLESPSDSNKQQDADSHVHKHNNNISKKQQTTSGMVTQLTVSTFDWNAIKKSNVTDLTSIQLPEGMKLIGIPINADEQVNKFEAGITLNLFSSEKAYKETGDLAYFDIGMIEDNQPFNKAKFDSDFDDYMQSIGAVQFFDGMVTIEVIKQLKDSDNSTNNDYMTADSELVYLRQYALNHENGTQSFYQIASNDQHGQIGLLEVTKPTAE